MPIDNFIVWLLLGTAGVAIGAVLHVMAEARRRREQEFKLLNNYSHEITQAVEAATNGIIVMDLNIPGYPVVFANNAFCEQTDSRRGDIAGQGLLAILGRDIDDEARLAIAEALDHTQACDLDIKITAKPQPRWFNLRLTPVKDSAGSFSLFIGVFSEITALKIREAEFFQAQKLEALGRLAAGVAHDFNNVLSIIQGFSRVAADDPKLDATIRNYLERISTAAQRGSSLTKQMLTFSQHRVVGNVATDLTRAIKEQEALLHPVLDASINLMMHSETPGLYVECPPDSLMQILLNLVINARDAMPRGGLLVVETRKCNSRELPSKIRGKVKEGDYACLSVMDSGSGMDKALQERIFDPFFTTKAPGKGTGLGLSMVYGMVCQMGGYIDVISAPGQGTTMAVYLPISTQTPCTMIQGSIEQLRDIDLKGYTVMVAEDEPELLEVLAGILEKFGMKVLRVSNGDEAMASQEEYDGRIDLLLTDVVMPSLDGLRLSKLLQSIRPELKTIFMSGYPANDWNTREELPQGTFFMAKPLRYETLAELIEQTLANTERPDYKAPHWKSSGVKVVV